MKTFFKVLCAVGMVAVVILLSIFPAQAEMIDVGSSTVYLHDNADLLSPTEEAKLVELCQDKCFSLSYNVLFLTYNDAAGKSTIRFTDDYMDDLFPYDEDNIAFVIDMDNREIYINTMGKAIDCLSDSEIERALDLGYSQMTDADAYSCLSYMASFCFPLLGNAPFGGVFFENMFSAIPFAAVATLTLVIILVTRHNEANKNVTSAWNLNDGRYSIEQKEAHFIKQYDTVQRGYYAQKSSSSSSSSHGSSHRSNSGRSHGGGGRKF